MSVLNNIQSEHYEFRQRKRIQTTKDEWGTLLETFFWQSQMQYEVRDRFLPVPISSKFNVSVTKHMWPTNKRHKWHWGTNNTEKLANNSGITAGFSKLLA